MFLSLQAMWGAHVLLVTLAVDVGLFFLCGVFAMLKHMTGPKPMRSPRWAAAVIVAPLLGVLSAVVLGAVPSFLIAAVYVNIPAAMSEWQALGWGCFLGVLLRLSMRALFNASCSVSSLSTFAESSHRVVRMTSTGSYLVRIYAVARIRQQHATHV